MRIKKLVRHITLGFLTVGASLILGLLSFGGMFALTPRLPLAFAAFGFSAAYEGEIYLQNIKRAWSKLFKRDYLKHQLANEFLLKHFPDTECSLINLSSHPNTLSIEILMALTNKKPVYALFDSQIYYINNIDFKPLKLEVRNIKLLQNNFTQNINVLQKPSKNNLANITSLTGHTHSCPEFFKSYNAQLQLLEHFGHIRLNKASYAQKKQVIKTLSDMEKWFSMQLFTEKYQTKLMAKSISGAGLLNHIEAKNEGAQGSSYSEDSYEHELHTWLALNQQDLWQAQLIKRNHLFKGVKIFSAFAAACMGLGTIYLLVETFTITPMIAAVPFIFWPLLITPMAIVAGIAYGLITYNAVTDMINDNSLHKWFNKLKESFSNGPTLKNVSLTAIAVILVVLAFALTICTAGTWWTITQNTRPLFAWMGKMPNFIMGIINPIVTGLSTIVFNLQNCSETLDIIAHSTEPAVDDPSLHVTHQTNKNSFTALRERENWLQILNPFRLLLKATILPLRIIFFLGHLISISVTADRMPGISQFTSALLGIISESFEDFHYFFGHNHGDHDTMSQTRSHTCNDEHHQRKHEHSHNRTQSFSFFLPRFYGHDLEHEHKNASLNDLRRRRLAPDHGHNHDLDIPTRVLKYVFYPVYFLAAAWDCLSSDARNPLAFSYAWDKQRGIQREQSIQLPHDAAQPSLNWKRTHILYLIQRGKQRLQKTSIGHAIADAKSRALTLLENDVRHIDPLNKTAINSRLIAETNNGVYNIHRLFGIGKTKTASLIENLQLRTSLCETLSTASR